MSSMCAGMLAACVAKLRRQTILAAASALSIGIATCAVAGAEPQFGGYCAEGLVQHHLIKTDCKINWIAKDGKTYCFGSDAAKAEFLKDPEANIIRATDNYAANAIEQISGGMDKFTSDDAQDFIDGYIKAQSAKNNGKFVVNDPVTSTSVPLAYDKVDFTRTIDGYGFFPDVIFHVPDDPQKKYLVDFWVAPQGDGLGVMETRIYEAPYKDGNTWTTMERQPAPWWWIPASEHPGHVEQKRSWEIMSAIDGYIARKTAANNGVLVLKDEVTGQNVPLDFIDVHQPVRRLKADGKFFACTDFRKKGTTDQYYDIDFWIDAKTGKLQVSDVKIHKVPFMMNGHYIQMSRYHFDKNTYDIIP
jgi:YHS domain-containing protein